MLRPWGFPEYLPWEQAIFDKIKNIIHNIWEQIGYQNIRTPAVEKNEILLKGGEDSSKQIFWLYGLAQWSEDTKDYSLHFDLTVPLARYVLDHEQDLAFPFKRIQIQPVRRWERSQRWRFKEFWQADIDIVWRANNDKSAKNLYCDAEVMFLAQNILQEVKQEFSLNQTISMHINNRKLVQWFANALFNSDDDKKQLFKLLDNYYKIWEEKFKNEIINLSNNTEIQDNIFSYTTINLESMTSLFSQENKLFHQWLEELQTVFSHLKALDPQNTYNFKFDPFIMRGLDYYTGTVYETFFEEDIKLWSIYSWWRYENLTSSISPKWKNKDFEWVWISMWISRVCALIFEQQEKNTNTNTERYLFINTTETFNNILKLYNKYTKEGKKCEIFPNPAKLQKQFNYAEKKQIPFVITRDEKKEKEIIKDIR